MTDSSDVDDETHRAIRDTTRSQPLGDGRGVRCSDCGQYMEPETRIKGYVVGDARGMRWKLSKVMHTDCGALFTPENINRNDDTDAIVEGMLVHDPSVSAGGPDETQVTETENAAMIEAPRGTHRLEEPEVKAVHMMSDEQKQRREETLREAEKLMEDIQSGDVEGHPLSDVFGGSSDESKDNS